MSTFFCILTLGVTLTYSCPRLSRSRSTVIIPSTTLLRTTSTRTRTHQVQVQHLTRRSSMRRRQVGQEGLENSAADKLDLSAVEKQVPKNRSGLTKEVSSVKGHPQSSALRFLVLFLFFLGIICGLYYYIDSSNDGTFHRRRDRPRSNSWLTPSFIPTYAVGSST